MHFYIFNNTKKQLLASLFCLLLNSMVLLGDGRAFRRWVVKQDQVIALGQMQWNPMTMDRDHEVINQNKLVPLES